MERCGLGVLELALKLSVIVIYQGSYRQIYPCLHSIERSMKFLDSEIECEVLTSKKPNKSVARNKLAKKAKGDILVFIDSDAEATDFWLHELLKPFDSVAVGAVGGPNILGFNATHREALADRILTSYFATWKSCSRYRVTGKLRLVNESELTSCNLAVRKEVFLSVGGFPPDVIPCEENVLLNNIETAGYALMYNPLAIVTHNRAGLFLPHLRKIFFYATGRGLMMKRGKGGIKLLPKFSFDYLFLGIGFILHYLAYVAGVIWGLLKK